ncbi:MAG: hypothetical protein ACOX88_09215 [Christensenellales bacterium]|jgi:hypothetical protein
MEKHIVFAVILALSILLGIMFMKGIGLKALLKRSERSQDEHKGQKATNTLRLLGIAMFIVGGSGTLVYLAELTGLQWLNNVSTALLAVTVVGVLALSRSRRFKIREEEKKEE